MCLRVASLDSCATVHNVLTPWPGTLTNLIVQGCHCKTLYTKELPRIRTFLYPLISHRTLQRYCRISPSLPCHLQEKKNQQSQEQKRKERKKKKGRKCFFYHKRMKSESYLTHWKHKLDPFTKQLPETYFSLLKKQEFKYLFPPSPSTEEWKGSHQTPQKETHKISCLHSALEYLISFQILCQTPECT